MSEIEEAAREQLRNVVDTLTGALYQLVGIAASLPGPTEAESRLEEESPEPGSPTEVRTAIDCVLADHLRPAIESLAAVGLSQENSMDRR